MRKLTNQTWIFKFIINSWTNSIHYNFHLKIGKQFFLIKWILTIILIEFKYLLMPFSFFSRNFPDESADSGLTRHRGGGLRGTQKDLCRVLLVKVGTWQWALHAMLPTPGPPPHSFPVLCYLCCHCLYYFDFNVGAQVHRLICWDGCPYHY